MVYYFWKYFFLTFFYLFCGWRVTGRDYIPAKGAVLVVSNHVSYWDPIVVGVAISRKVNFMAKSELFGVPILGWMIKSMDSFPVARGAADRQAIKVAIRHLKEEHVVGIFPEGSRNLDSGLLHFQPGVASLAIKNETQVVPLAVKGTINPFRGLWFNPVTVNIGKPLLFGKGSDPEMVIRTLENAVSQLLI